MMQEDEGAGKHSAYNDICMIEMHQSNDERIWLSIY